MWVLLGTTDLRSGEALALRWSDVNLPGRKLHVRRVLQRQNGKGLVFGEPKTKASRRTVELSDIVCDALRNRQTRQEWEKRHAENGLADLDLVFCTGTGKPLDRGRVHINLKSVLKKAGLPAVRIHDLRHSSPSIMLHELGLSVRLVSEMLGHSNITMTLGTYGHLMPTMHREATDKIDALFRRQNAVGSVSLEIS